MTALEISKYETENQTFKNILYQYYKGVAMKKSNNFDQIYTAISNQPNYCLLAI